MRAVNLLPANAYAAKQRVPHAPIVLAAAVPVLAGALVYLGQAVEHSHVVNRETQLGLVQSQITALGPTPSLINEASQVGSLRATRETALQDALAKRVEWDVTFDHLSRVLPQGAFFTSLAATSPTPSTSSTPSVASPTGVTIQGYADSQETVAQVLARLALVPGLSNIALANTTSNTDGAKAVVQFNITAAIASGS
jgi:Tfp pilus assembly protein PilN